MIVESLSYLNPEYQTNWITISIDYFMSAFVSHPKLFSESVFISYTCYGMTPDRARLPSRSLLGLDFPDKSISFDLRSLSSFS